MTTGSQQAEDFLLDEVFFGIGQFEAVVAEDLEAVVLVGIVRGGDNHAGDERTGAREVGDAGSGDDAGIMYANALAGQASGHHLRDPRSALARVGADQDLRVRGMGGGIFTERDAECIDCRGIQRKLSRHAANSVGTE